MVDAHGVDASVEDGDGEDAPPGVVVHPRPEDGARHDRHDPEELLGERPAAVGRDRIEEQREMPARPRDADEHARRERAVLLLEDREHEAPPAEVLLPTAPDRPPRECEEIDERRFERREVDRATGDDEEERPECEHEEREAERKQPPPGADAPLEHLGHPFPEAAAARPDHDRGADRWPEPPEPDEDRLRPRRLEAEDGDDPLHHPRERVRDREEAQDAVLVDPRPNPRPRRSFRLRPCHARLFTHPPEIRCRGSQPKTLRRHSYAE